MKSTLLPMDLSQEVEQRETENPNTPLTMYLITPGLSKQKSIPFKAPIDVGTPSHQHKTHCILKNLTSLPTTHRIAIKNTFETSLDLHHLP